MRIGFAINLDVVYDPTISRQRISHCDVDVYHLQIPQTRVTQPAGAPGLCTHVVTLVNCYLKKYADLSQDLLDPTDRSFTVPSSDFIPASLPTGHLPLIIPLPSNVTIDFTRMIERLERVAVRWHKVHSS